MCRRSELEDRKSPQPLAGLVVLTEGFTVGLKLLLVKGSETYNLIL